MNTSKFFKHYDFKLFTGPGVAHTPLLQVPDGISQEQQAALLELLPNQGASFSAFVAGEGDFECLMIDAGDGWSAAMDLVLAELELVFMPEHPSLMNKAALDLRGPAGWMLHSAALRETSDENGAAVNQLIFQWQIEGVNEFGYTGCEWCKDDLIAD